VLVLVVVFRPVMCGIALIDHTAILRPGADGVVGSWRFGV
jgi:hypothetical protein